MDFKLSEQHEMLKKTISDFASKEIAPIAGDIDKSGELPWECVRKLAQLGTFGLLVPPPFGFKRSLHGVHPNPLSCTQTSVRGPFGSCGEGSCFAYYRNNHRGRLRCFAS